MSKKRRSVQTKNPAAEKTADAATLDQFTKTPKFLSIIIPSYNETPAQIFQLLASISTQIGVDVREIEIIIMKDGGGAPYPEQLLRMFPLDLKQYALPENVGPGLCRQAGINVATGEYLMFCDADDILQNVGALQTLIAAARDEKHPDIVRSSWLEETVNRETNELRYVTHKGENTWMHGKLLRRQFLIDHHIEFHPSLRVHEDTYFLSVAAAYADVQVDVEPLTYLWRFTPNSITRADNWAYEFNSLPEFARAACLAHEATERVKPEQMEYKTLQLACYIYFIMNQPKWTDPKVAEYKAATEQSLARNIRATWHYFMNASPESVMQVYNQERAKHFPRWVEVEPLGVWLARIGLPVPDWLKPKMR